MTKTYPETGTGSAEIRDMEFGYGRAPLFSGLDLDLEPGNIYGLLGKNGAGKTSLLRILSGLLFPEKGTVAVDRWIPAERSPGFLSEVYILPEEFSLPQYSPDRYIDLYAPFYPRFTYEGMEEYLREFEIPRRVALSSLSYGQKKKFLLAFGLASGCSLFLLDEPTNGLDIPSKSQFRRLVASAVSDDRVFVISTHQVRDVEHLIDPVIIIEGGKIVFDRTFEEIHAKLTVCRTEQIPGEWHVLYSEPDMKGFTVVLPRETAVGAADLRAIDLETLFNTVVQNPPAVDALFDGGNAGEGEGGRE
jgi:ABC-2 type transport system ATP-binding protein